MLINYGSSKSLPAATMTGVLEDYKVAGLCLVAYWETVNIGMRKNAD